MILDINHCKSYEQIINAMDSARELHGKYPQKLIVKRSVFAEIRKRDRLFALEPPPLHLGGATIIYQENVDYWKKLRDQADPIEFWVEYWSRKDKLWFDPLEENVGVKLL